MRATGILFFSLSFIAYAAGIARFIVARHTQKLTQRLLALTVAVIVAILMARFGLSACGIDRLSPSFFVEIMQAFSLDADYGMLNEVYPALGGGPGSMLLLAYLAILYSTAPITGGAIVYDVLAGVSPSIKLWFRRRRPAYIFSEINDASVTLAEKASDVKMGSSTLVSGFGYGIKNMHADESAAFVFGYDLGYGSSGGTDKNMVPPYAALRFDVELVPNQ